jgi:hypothetical protein
MIEALRSLMVLPQPDRHSLGCWLYVDALDPNSLCYMEAWAHPKDLEREILSERFTRLLSVMESAAQRPVLEFQFCDQTRGLDLVEEVRNAMARGSDGEQSVPA